MKHRIHNGIIISKKEQEFIKFLLSGSNSFQDAYFIYEARKRTIKRNMRTIASWFNKTLEGLKKKNLCDEIPFILIHPNGFIWSNPGIRANRDSYVALTLQEDFQLSDYELKRII